VNPFLERLITTIISIGSLILPSISGIDPVFSHVDFLIEGNRLLISAALDNCYSEDFDTFLKSGETIRLNFTLELFAEKQNRPIAKQVITHQVRYNLIEQRFVMIFSEYPRSVELATLEQVHAQLVRLHRVEALSAKALKSQQRYYLVLSADLASLALVGRKDPFNLMLLWNKTAPRSRSQTFSLDDFIL